MSKVFALSLMVLAAAAQSPLSPVRIILVGDSTMADRSGYGPGFCADVVPEVTCINMAKGGRSSLSYRAEGSWARVMEQLKHNSEFKDTYVLIQFGHNDQPGKPGRSTDLANEFPVNIRQYVEDVKSTGAKTVLVTPLTRRSFRNGQLRNDLEPWAAVTKKVAAEESVPVLDLNAESAAAIQKMGPAEANTLAMAPPPQAIAETAATGNSDPAPKAPALPNNPPDNVVERKGEAAPTFDYTHLGAKGAAFFGGMVADELMGAVPELKPYFIRRSNGAGF